MQAGKIVNWDAFGLVLSVSGSLSVSGMAIPALGIHASGSVITRYMPTGFSLSTGLSLTAKLTLDSTGTYTRDFFADIPTLGISWHRTAGGTGSMACELNMLGLRIYATNTFGWVAIWTGIEFIVNGVTTDTAGAGTTSSAILTPAALPFIGIPGEISALGTSSLVPTPPPVPTTTVYDITALATATGGWRIKEPGGGWISLPVNLAKQAVEDSCCDGYSFETCEATNTSNAVVAGRTHIYNSLSNTVNIHCPCVDPCTGVGTFWDVSDGVSEFLSTGNTICLFPDIEKAVYRMNSDYAALVARIDFPAVKRVVTTICNTCPDEFTTPDCYLSSSIITDLFARESVLLANVGPTTHAIEDVFNHPTYAPYERQFASDKGTQKVGVRTDHVSRPCLCPTPGIGDPPYDSNPSNCWDTTFTRCNTVVGEGITYVESRDDWGALSDFYDCRVGTAYDYLARYANSWSNPHWRFAPYFYADASGAIGGNEWTVDGSRVNPSEYWAPIRTQWLYNSALPSGEQTKRRNSFVSDPLFESGLGPLVAGVFGLTEVGFWGISRFDVDSTAPLSEYDYTSASSAAWSGTDCTLAHGSDITVTPSALGFKVKLDLGRWTEAPYMYPHIAKQIAAPWVNHADIVSVNVYLVSQAGDKVLLTNINSTTPLTRTRRADTKYAGSWGQDDGMGVVTDTGTDDLGSGVSAASMADPELVFALCLLAGRTASYLEYDFVVSDASHAYHVKYPKFYRSSDDATIIPENGHHQDLIWPDGPGVRYGQWAWLETDPFTVLLSPPNVYPIGFPPLGWKSSSLDAICWKNEVLLAQDRATALQSGLQAIYDNYELIGTDTAPSGANQVYREGDTFTLSFLIPGSYAGRLAMVNSYREVPPLCQAPYRKRDAAMQPTGTLAQVAYSYVSEPRRIVAPSTVDEFPPIGGAWTGPSSIVAPSGWTIREENHAVDNTETGFKMRALGVDYATVRPWHGFFCNLYVVDAETEPRHLQRDDGWSHWAVIIGGDVFVKTSEFCVPLPAWRYQVYATSSGDCSRPRLMFDEPTSRLSLRYTRAGLGTYEVHSDDDGATWSTAVAD